MKISEYILCLEQIQRNYGDIEVQKYGHAYERVTAPAPVVCYEAILKGRETKPRFAHSSTEDHLKGVVVCKV